ncbi:MAG TPA: hypothetical protein VGR30_10725 [Candidatus Binatia bacterium]|jgi:hypothetical protein|nr:hypothetical protein [Candidatus Binatia bacterium]
METILLAQGIYYFFSGIWPILHMRSFLAVTGPKTDLWLVKTVGILVAVIGATLVVAGMNQRVTLEVLLLAIGSQLALIAIDVIYVAAKTISKIYLLDAILEIGLLLGWLSFGLGFQAL